MKTLNFFYKNSGLIHEKNRVLINKLHKIKNQKKIKYQKDKKKHN